MTLVPVWDSFIHDLESFYSFYIFISYFLPYKWQRHWFSQHLSLVLNLCTSPQCQDSQAQNLFFLRLTPVIPWHPHTYSKKALEPCLLQPSKINHKKHIPKKGCFSSLWSQPIILWRQNFIYIQCQDFLFKVKLGIFK